jgi:hypothetical protein
MEVLENGQSLKIISLPISFKHNTDSTKVDIIENKIKLCRVILAAKFKKGIDNRVIK